MTRSAVVTILTILASHGAHGQSADTHPAFEVASVKPVAPDSGSWSGGMRGGPGTNDPTRFSAENMSLSSLVMRAYGINRFQFSGPSWMDTERFNVAAKVREGATKEQFRLMLQSLLAERFRLTLHHEQKEMPIYELVAGKNGPKLKESVQAPARKDGGPEPAPPLSSGPPEDTLGKDGYPVLPAVLSAGTLRVSSMSGRTRLQATQVSMEQLAGGLSMDRPVKDATGLKGKYDFSLTWVRSNMRSVQVSGDTVVVPPDDDSGPTIFTAIQEQLGLKLEPKKGPADILVVDHVERLPAGN